MIVQQIKHVQGAANRATSSFADLADRARRQASTM
jgi:hypothetical protein